jgi:hypothetical protein
MDRDAGAENTLARQQPEGIQFYEMAVCRIYFPISLPFAYIPALGFRGG